MEKLEGPTISNESSKAEKEFSPEKPEKFDAVVVFGKWWRELPPEGATPENYRLYLSVEAKMSSLVAGLMFEEGVADKIIIAGGKTAGEKWQSEAAAMKEYLLKKYPHISEDSVVTEEKSIDTAQNAENASEIIKNLRLEKVACLAIKHHLKRSQKLLEAYGVKTEGFATEALIDKRSPHYKKLVEKFLDSPYVKTEELKEFILRSLLRVDPKGKLPRLLTDKLRHGGRLAQLLTKKVSP